MKIYTACKLTHTLQTHFGMVIGNGEPQIRPYPSLPSSLTKGRKLLEAPSDSIFNEEGLVLLLTSCVLEGRLSRFLDGCKSSLRKRLEANIYACCNEQIGIAFMKGNIASLQRLDLEQAAAVVIAAVRNDSAIANRLEIVRALLNEIDGNVFRDSCMWLEDSQLSAPTTTINDRKFSDLVEFIRRVIQGGKKDSIVKMGHIDGWSSLLPILLQIRRSAPRSRCLFIPKWTFRAANATPPPEFRIWDHEGRTRPGNEPRLPPNLDSIVLSRSKYRCIQRRLLRHDRFWDPTVALRKEIKDLDADVMNDTYHIRSLVLPSTDTLVMAHHFFALQRCLQRKVVSDLNWTFLAKGESSTIMQNNTSIRTSFENRLADFCRQKEEREGLPIADVTAQGGAESLLPQIDRCCLLMESYVRIYGHGDRNELVFTRGWRGGFGRGPVDEYNKLCDVLSTLCEKVKTETEAKTEAKTETKEMETEKQKAKSPRMPGPVRKFLAKDIMVRNRSWDDDAFAGGYIPGWETWLRERREMGVLEEWK